MNSFANNHTVGDNIQISSLVFFLRKECRNLSALVLQWQYFPFLTKLHGSSLHCGSIDRPRPVQQLQFARQLNLIHSLRQEKPTKIDWRQNVTQLGSGLSMGRGGGVLWLKSLSISKCKTNFIQIRFSCIAFKESVSPPFVFWSPYCTAYYVCM